MILFEDKIKSKNHSNQLERYTKVVNENFNDHEIIKIYLKTDYVWRKEKDNVESQGFSVFGLAEICETLKLEKEIDNQIYNDYVKFVTNRLTEYKSFSNLPVKKWNSNQWIGLNRYLSKKITYDDFGRYYRGEQTWFIINWEDNFFDSCHLSLEIYMGKLLVKGHVPNKEKDVREFRNKILPELKDKFSSFNYSQSNRNGRVTTLLILNDFPFVNKTTGKIDLERTIELIKNAKERFEQVECG